MSRTVSCLAVLSVLICVTPADSGVVRTEDFGVDPGWSVVGSGLNGNDFGYQPSSWYAGGSTGEGGGTFTRSTFVKYYADTRLGGTLTLDQAFSASGKLASTDASFPDFGYPCQLGHFSTTGFGMVGVSLTNADTEDLYWRAGIVLDDFTSFGTTPVLVTEDIEHTWAYDWDPTGGTGGTGLLTLMLDSDINTIELTAANRAKGATLDAFGFAGTAAPNRNYPEWYANIYFDDLTYTVTPEPSSAIVWLLLGALAFAVIRQTRCY